MAESNGRQDQDGDSEQGKFRVDEDWKKSVAQERGEKDGADASDQQAEAGEFPEPNFTILLAGLYSQTLMALGEIENPITKGRQPNLPEARYLVDTIGMLKEKTEGNLSEEEATYLNGLLHDLRMRYVAAVDSRPAEGEQDG